MNHVYRLKRSGRAQLLQPVPESVRASGKGTRTATSLAQAVTATLASFALGGMATLAHAQQAPPAANQLPQGGVVTRGSANIVTNTGQTQLTVNQSSNRAVIDWTSFNVGSQAKVQFNQPSSSAVTLNNILGNNASQIYGQISANGQVFLSNPNGVYFSPTAQVNVGGLVATTGKANADEFMAGKASFNRGGSTGSVVNEGQLTSAAGGYIALLAPEVRNQGVVVAQAGTVALASGEAITLSFNNSGTGLAGITTTPQTIAALVENRSAVLAGGGQIILSAHALAALQGSVVKNSGQLSATSLTEKGGKIVLMADSIELTGTSRIDANGPQGGGTVLVGGDWQGSGDMRQATRVTMVQGTSIEANATEQGDGGKVVLWSDVHYASSVTQVDGRIEAKGAGTGNGGLVETSGQTLQVGAKTQVNTGGGEWLLDPSNITISSSTTSSIALASNAYTPTTGAASSVVNATTLVDNLASNNINITTTNTGTSGAATGNITVATDLSWASTKVLTLTAAGGISGTGNISMTGAAGTGVVFNQAGNSTYAGSISGNNATFTKQGAGTLTLSSASNAYLNTVISAGMLKLGHAAALGTGTDGSVTVATGAALDLNGFSVSAANAKPLTISGTGVSNSGALLNSINNTTSVYPGLLTLGAHASIATSSNGANIVLSNPGTITGTGLNLTLGGALNSNNSIASIIGTGSGTVTINGSYSASWTLSGANTYTGGTTVSTGVLRAGSPTAFGTGPIAVSAGPLTGGYQGGTLDLNGQTMTTSAGLTIGGLGIALSTGVLINSSTTTATYPGLVTLSANTTIQANNGSIILSNPGTITGSGFNLSLEYGTAAGSRIDSIIGTGTGTVTKRFPGTWLLNGVNTYSGGTTIIAGTLMLGNAAALGSGSVVVTGGELDLNGRTLTGNQALSIAGFGGKSGGALSNSSASQASYAGQITLTANAGISGNIHLTNSNAISGAFQLRLGGDTGGTISSPISTNSILKSGASTWVVDRVATTNTINIFGGTLAAGRDDVFTGTITMTGIESAMPVLSLGAYSLAPSSVMIQRYGGNITSTTGVLSGQVTVHTDGSKFGSNISAILGGNSTLLLGMSNANPSTLTLTRANTYTGLTNIANGTLQLGDGGTTGSLSPSTAISISSGSTLAYNLSTGAAPTNSFNNSGTIANLAYGSALDLSGASFSTAGKLSPSVNATQATPTVASIVLPANPSLTGSTFNVITTGYQSSFAAQTAVSWAGTSTGSPTLQLNGLAAVSGQPALGGTLNLSSSQLTIGGSGAIWAIVNNGSTRYINSASDATSIAFLGTPSIVVPAGVSATQSGAFTGTVALTITGGGTLTLSGDNSGYSEAKTVSAGVLKAGSNTALGTGTNTVSFGAALDLNGQALSTAGALSLKGVGINGGGALMNSGGSASYSGAVSIGSDTLISGGSGAVALTNTGSLGGNVFVLSLGGAVGGSVSGVVDTTFFGLTKEGTGTWTLSGTNTYTTATNVNAGVLKAGSARAFGTGAINVASGAALDLNGQVMTSTGTLTLNGTGVNNGGVLMNSSTSPATYAGAVSLGSDSLITGGNGTVALSSTSNLTGGNYALTLGGAAGGRVTPVLGLTLSSLTKQDAGTWTLSAANSAYVGGITVNAGTLAAGVATSAFGAASNSIVVNGGTLALGTFSQTVGDVTIGANGGAITADTGKVLTGTRYTINNNGPATATVSAILAGTVPLIKTGTGLATLSGENTYIGDTTINGGTLSLGAAGALSTAGTISFGGGTLQYSASNTADYSSRISTLSGQAYSVDTNGQSVTWATNLASTSASLTKSGTGTLTLGGSNNLSGGVSVNAGTLQASNAAALGSGSVAVAASATLAYNVAGAATPSNAFTGAGIIANVAFGRTLDLSGATLSGFTGTYEAAVNESVSPNTVAAIVLPSGLNLASNTLSVNTTGVDLSFADTPVITWSGSVSGTPSFKLNGTVVSANQVVNNRSLAFNAGNLTLLGGPPPLWTMTINGVVSSFMTDTDTLGANLNGPTTINIPAGVSVTESGVLSGFGDITITGGGSILLSGNNSYTGITNIINARVKLGHASALGTGTSGVTVSSGSVLDLNGQNVSALKTLTLNGSGVSNGGALKNSHATAASWAGAVALGSATTIVGGTGTIALLGTGAINGSNTGLALGGAAGGSVAGSINTGTGSVTVQDGGTWTLSGANTYSGGTVINASTLQISSDGNLGAVPGSPSTNVTLNGGTLQVANPSAALTLGANRLISVGSAGGNINNTSTTHGVTLNGAVSGSGAFTFTSAKDLTVGDIALSNNSTILLKAAGNITHSGSKAVSTAGGSITYWADSDGSGDGNITLQSGTSGNNTRIDSGGADIVLAGGSGASAAAGYARGALAVDLQNNRSINAGAGNVTVQGSSNVSGGSGVRVSGGTVIGAVVNITGKGFDNASGTTLGLDLGSEALIRATSQANITGIGGATLPTASSTFNNKGILMTNAIIEATGSGNVVVNGTGGGYLPGLSNTGLDMIGGSSDTVIRSVNGTVTINAAAGPSNSPGASQGLIARLLTSANLGFGGPSQTGAITVRADNMVASPQSSGNYLMFQSTGTATLEPLGSTFGAVDLSYMSFANTISGLTVGRPGNTSGVVFGPTSASSNPAVSGYSIAGPINVYGSVAINRPVASTGTGSNGLVTLSGSVIQRAGGSVSGTGLLLAGTGASSVIMRESGNAFGTLAGSGLGSHVYLTNSSAMNVGTLGSTQGLTSTGSIELNTTQGDLTLSHNISTTSTASDAVLLTAGRGAAVGDTTSGNLVLNGGTITTGINGRVLFYTGAVNNPSLTTLVGSGSGRFRYGSTRSVSNFKTGLGASGYYVIYRERPTVSWSSAADQSIVYGNTPVAPTAGTPSGFVNGDLPDTSTSLRTLSTNALAVVNPSGYYNAGSYMFSRTVGAQALGYLGSNPGLTITAAPLTVRANDATKTYNGLPYSGGNGVSYSGLLAGDTVSNSLGGALSYSGTAQSAVNASSYSIIPGGLTSNNYSLNFVNGTLTVNKAPLTVRAKSDARFIIENDAVNYAGASYIGFVAGQTETTAGVLGGSLTVTRTGGDTQPGIYNNVLVPSGLTAANYTISYVPGTYTIVPADQLLVKMSDTATTYGSAANFAVNSARYYKSSNNTIYDLTSSVNISASSLTLNDGAGGNTAFTLGALSPALSSGGRLNVGAYQLGAASITNSSINYSNTITVTGAMQVNPLAVTASLTSSVSKAYDGTPAMNGVGLSVSGGLSGDVLTANGSGAFVGKDAGTNLAYTVSNIALDGADARNYLVVDSVSNQPTNTLAGSNGVITTVPLTITANNANKTYDGVEWSGGNGVTYNGFVNNETEAVLGGALAYGGTSQGAVNAGNYAIVPSGYTSTNYTLAYANGTLVIDPAGLTAIVGNLQGSVSKIYDGTNTATLSSANYALSGWVGSDGATVTKTSGTYDNANAGSIKTVTVSLVDADYTATGGTNLSNYTLPSTISGAVGTITSKPVTVTNTSRTTTYDGTSTYGILASGTAFTTSPLVGSDNVVSVTQTASGAGVTSAGVAQAGSFTVSPSSAVMGTGTASNYSFSYVNSTHTVSPAQVTVTPITGALQGIVSKVYDGNNTATLTSANYALTGWLNSDGATVTKTTGTYDNANAGSGKTVTVSLSQADYVGTGSTNLSNYALPSSISGVVGSISKAVLTATGNSASVTYNATNQSVNGFVLSGLKGNDTVSSLTSVVSSGATGKNAGSYTNIVTAGTEKNYTVTTVNGSLTIAKANATVTANSGMLIYNGASQTVSGFTASGLVGGETTSVLTGVTATRTEKKAGTYVTSASGTDGNYNLTFVDGSMVIKDEPSALKRPVVLTPALAQQAVAYQVTVLKLPQNNEAGVVHIELRDGLEAADVELPAKLQTWMDAAGAELNLVGAVGVVELSPSRRAIRVLPLAERQFPLQFAMQAGQQRLSFRIVKRP